MGMATGGQVMKRLVTGVAGTLAVAAALAGCGTSASEAPPANTPISSQAPVQSQSPSPSTAPPASSVSPSASSAPKPDKARPKKQPTKAAVPTPMPTGLQTQGTQTLDQGETVPKAGDGPTVDQIASEAGRKVVKLGPIKQTVGSLTTYQTQYMIGDGDSQIGSIVIATGNNVGTAPGDDELKTFSSYGTVEHVYGGTVLRYQAGPSYLAMGYFGSKLVTITAGSAADLKSLYGYFKASA